MADKTSEPGGLTARRAAHHLMQGVTGEGRLLSELIGGGALDALDPADRARAQRLATEGLRQLDRADRMLKPHLKKRPGLWAMNALRLGTLELVQGEAAHGVVNAYVEIVARNKRAQSFKGLVNAVLRKVAGDLSRWGRLPAPVMPPWLRRPLVDAWGRAAMARIETAHAAGAPLDLTAKGDPAAVAAATGGQLLPTGSVRLAAGAGQVSALPGYDAGDWWVQDAAAALPVRLIGELRGLSVLDLCAAPGGKTLQLAAGHARVTAVDASATRMERLTQNLARTGLSAETRVSDAFDVTGVWDVVLLDAPCSATGTIRRHPDLPHAKDGAEFGALIDQQAAMIDHALTLLRPGGRLVYCTCSLLPDEGEVQVLDALDRHSGVRVVREALDQPGIDPDWITEEGGLRLRPDHWPDLGGIDGFYIAVLAKPA